MAQSGNLIRWGYVDDKNVTYRRAAKKAITDQVNGSAAVKVGGATCAASVLHLPKHIKPRGRYVTDGTDVRFVVCYDTTCDLWTLDNATITLVKGGADVVFTVTEGRRSESRRAGIGQTT